MRTEFWLVSLKERDRVDLPVRPAVPVCVVLDLTIHVIAAKSRSCETSVNR
jgi:hypothetical protein